jgi:plasmid stability protein
MRRVPTLHLRNVPATVYEGLRDRAKRNGRSMNAEAVALLAESVAREARAAPITDELRRLAREINRNRSPDAPAPEDFVREMRDAPPRGV